MAVILGLTLLGLGLSVYLAVAGGSVGGVACFGGGSCEAVQGSAYSSILGVRVAVLGVVAYAFILAWAALGLLRPAGRGRPAGLVVFGASLGGFLFSAYLTAVSGLVIGVYCPLCLVSAGTMLAILAVSVRTVLAR